MAAIGLHHAANPLLLTFRYGEGDLVKMALFLAVADRVAAFGGSWTFIGLFLTGMMAWMIANEEAGRAFDPYPFILLNLVLSCVAALQAPVIMMSQNRQNAKDRLGPRALRPGARRSGGVRLSCYHKLF